MIPLSNHPQVCTAAVAVITLFVVQRILLSRITKSLDDSDQKEKKAVGEHEKWRIESKAKSGKFVRTALFNHIVIKARKTIHGMAGLICLCFSFIQIAWVLVTGGRQRGPAIFDKATAITVVGLFMGFFTPWFQKKKMKKLGRFQDAEYGLASVAVAFAMAANSEYACIDFPIGENLDYFTKACTTVFGPLFTLSSIVYFTSGMITHSVLLSPVPAIGFTTSIPFFTAAPIYEMLWGREALAILYKTHRVADLVYFLNMSGVLLQLSTNVMTVMAMIKALTMEQVQRINSKMFVPYGLASMAAITAVLGPGVCAAYVLCIGLAIPFHKVFPVKNLTENRKEIGMFIAENGGNSLGLGVKGTD